MSIAAAWSLVKIADQLAARKLAPALIIVPVFCYLGLFVYDGERVFLQEPRNKAARWVLQNLGAGGSYSWRGHADLEGYEHVYYPDMGNPDVIVIEMHHGNHYLSGMGLKNSFPVDFRYIFDSGSQDRIDALQSLFMGTSGYEEATRFSEGYFMPEFILVDRLIGNRSRNYVAEIVIFVKSDLWGFCSALNEGRVGRWSIRAVPQKRPNMFRAASRRDCGALRKSART